jgi:hypothetical protein
MAGGDESQYLNNLRQNGLSKQKDANEKNKNTSEFRFIKQNYRNKHSNHIIFLAKELYFKIIFLKKKIAFASQNDRSFADKYMVNFKAIYWQSNGSKKLFRNKN